MAIPKLLLYAQMPFFLFLFLKLGLKNLIKVTKGKSHPLHNITIWFIPRIVDNKKSQGDDFQSKLAQHLACLHNVDNVFIN
jgi:hypothetical protein